MDPITLIGLLASLVALLELAKPVYSQLGPSDKNQKELNRLLIVLKRFEFIYQLQKDAVQSFQDTGNEHTIKEYLSLPLEECHEVIRVLELRLKSTNFLTQNVIGKRWDKSFQKCIERLEEVEKLYQLIVQGDQHGLIYSIENHLHSSADVLQMIQTGVSELSELSESDNAQMKAYIEEITSDLKTLQQKALEAQNKSMDIQLGVEQLRSDAVEDRKKEAEKEAEKEERELCEQIVHWLRVADYTLNHAAARNKHSPETGKWFVESADYREWLVTPSSFFWLHGMPGCGKTILASSIIETTREYCQLDDHRFLGYFYFSFTSIAKQNLTNLLCCVISQLVKQSKVLPDCLRKLHANYGHGTPPLADLEYAFIDIVNLIGNVFLIVDALDEIPERGDRKILSKVLGNFSNPNLHVLVTSRRERDIEQSISDISGLRQFPIQSHIVDDDIKIYLSIELQDTELFKSLDSSFQEQILENLKIKASGMFRFAEFQVEAIKDCLSVNEIHYTLDHMPESLDEVYNRILSKIPAKHYQSTISALKWLAFSLRPITIEELAEVAVFRAAFQIHDRFQIDRDVLKLLSGLVITRRIASKRYIHMGKNKRNSRRKEQSHEEHKGKAEVVQLAHFSVKEYLTSDRVSKSLQPSFAIEEIDSHVTITITCLEYIKYACEQWQAAKFDFDEFFDPTPSPLARPHVYYPLLEYSTFYCLSHTKLCQKATSDRLWNRITEFFRSAQQFQFWQEALKKVLEYLHPTNMSGINHWITKQSPFITAATLKLDEVCNSLFVGQKLTRLEEADSKVLKEYIYQRKDTYEESFVQLLIDHGVDIDCGVLSLATFYGNFDLVQLLLNNGADINSRDEEYGTPIEAAIECPNWKTSKALEMVKFMLERGADVNAYGQPNGTPLQLAVRLQNTEMVEFLLRHGANPKIQGIYGNSLYSAVLSKSRHRIRDFLDLGVDVNAKGGHYGYPLQAASWEGDSLTVRLLIDRGADVNAKGGDYTTALHAAALNEEVSIARLLLDHGADPNIEDEDYGMPLQIASYNADVFMLRLLLNKGADVNAKGGHLGTALQIAFYAGNDPIVEYLIARGAHIR